MITWKISFKNKINETLKEHKDKNGISKTWVAKQLNMSLQNLSALETSSNPSLITLAKVAFILEVPIESLYHIDIERIISE